MDLVCEECGSDPVYVQRESTSFVDSARTFDRVAIACSNRACVYSNPNEVGLTGFTVTRAEWDAQRAERAP